MEKKRLTEQEKKQLILDWLADMRGNRRLEKIFDPKILNEVRGLVNFYFPEENYK